MQEYTYFDDKNIVPDLHYSSSKEPHSMVPNQTDQQTWDLCMDNFSNQITQKQTVSDERLRLSKPDAIMSYPSPPGEYRPERYMSEVDSGSFDNDILHTSIQDPMGCDSYIKPEPIRAQHCSLSEPSSSTDSANQAKADYGGTTTTTNKGQSTAMGAASRVTDDTDNHSNLLHFLRNLRIEEVVARTYFQQMRECGFDDVTALEDAREDDLKAIGIKLGHARRMKRAASKGILPSEAKQLPHATSTQSLPKDYYESKFESLVGNVHYEINKHLNQEEGNQPMGSQSFPQETLIQGGHDAHNIRNLGVLEGATFQQLDSAKHTIAQQAARIQELEAQLATFAKHDQSSSQCRQQVAKHGAGTTTLKPRSLIAKERLDAHIQRKSQENKYKEKSGKWEKPSVRSESSLIEKVARKDDFVDRLSASASERRTLKDSKTAFKRCLRKQLREEEGGRLDSGSSLLNDEQSNLKTATAPSKSRKKKRNKSGGGQPKDRLHKKTSLNDGQSRTALLDRLGMNAKQRRISATLPSKVKNALQGHKVEKKPWRMSEEFSCSNIDDKGKEDGHAEAFFMDCTVTTRGPAKEFSDQNEEQCNEKSDYRDDAVRCKTCSSTANCEEDVDNPGVFYCQRCWDEYEYEDTTHNAGHDDVSVEGQAFCQSQPENSTAPSPSPPRHLEDQRLWIMHDNPQLDIKIDDSRRIKCLVETNEPGKKNCVRIITGDIDYSGAVHGATLQEGIRIGQTEQGTECVRLCNLRGHIIDHSEVETRLSKDRSIIEFRLDVNNRVELSGPGCSISVEDFFSNCHGAVDVILDPQCSPGGWYPHREANAATGRKIAPQFRSKGVGYIRLGDDMSQNGLDFLSSDDCKTFITSSISSIARSNGRDRGGKELKLPTSKAKQGQNLLKAACGSNDRLSQPIESDMVAEVETSDDEVDSVQDDAEELIRTLQNDVAMAEMKWQEKSDLITRLGTAIASTGKEENAHASGALTVIGDIMSSKNTSSHVLRSAIVSIEKIGQRLGHELVRHATWRTILLDALKLLKNKQLGTAARHMLDQLHGPCFCLSNSLPSISQALGISKNSGSKPTKPANGHKTYNGTTGSVQVIEWLNQAVKAEKNMTNTTSMLDRKSLETLAGFFLSHLEHRTPICRQHVHNGLAYVSAYAVQRLGIQISEAMNLFSDVKESNPRVWKTIKQFTNEAMHA